MLEKVIVLPKCLWITYKLLNKIIAEEVEVTSAVYDLEGCRSISYIDSDRRHQEWFRDNKNIEFFETKQDAVNSVPNCKCDIKYFYKEFHHD